MKIKEYIKNTTNPFIDTTATHPNSFLYSDKFQTELTKHISLRHGRKEIAESVIEDAEDNEVNVEVIIREIAEDVYTTNFYNYNKLWSVYGLEYDPLFNWDRREDEFTSNVTGEQKITHKQGENTVTNSYGSRLNINTKGEQTNTNEYDKVHSENLKGEQENVNIYGEQNNVNTYGSHKETTNKGEQENVNTYGKVEKSITKGEQNNQNTYGAKTEVNTIGETNQTDTVGGRTKTNNYGEQLEQNQIGIEHKMSEESVTVGVSSYDDNSEFGNSGIGTDENNNYVIQDNGDGAFSPKERTLTDKTENTAGRIDNKFNSAHYDSEIIGNSTDTHKTDAHTDIKSNTGYSDSVKEGSRTDSETTKQRADAIVEGQRVDIKETDSYSDSVKVNAHNDSVIDGARTDINETDARTDKTVDGKRVDTTEQVGYNDSIVNGAREDQDINGQRADSFSRHYYGRGNVGTTTSQDMVLQEAELADKIKKILDIVARDIISQIACTVY